MSKKSNEQGRAYEYAWMGALYETLISIRRTVIVSNSSVEANRQAWNELSEDRKRLFAISAKAAVNTLLELEPRITEDDGDVLSLEFQKDGAGGYGDVRDIVIRRRRIRWEVGLSVKHNHEAIKHSRLSYKLDFGKEWFALPCSKAYWDAIRPIFDRLQKEKEAGRKWSDMSNKADTVYIPLLNAFVNEIKRANTEDTEMPRKMVQYLIGAEDYYKVISHDKERLTVIRTFNMHKTLNKAGKQSVSEITVPVVELPTEMLVARIKPGSDNTAEMYLNNGWQLSFRIHNASSKVEPSLKFDIQFVGMPRSILSINCQWNKADTGDSVRAETFWADRMGRFLKDAEFEVLPNAIMRVGSMPEAAEKNSSYERKGK